MANINFLKLDFKCQQCAVPYRDAVPQNTETVKHGNGHISTDSPLSTKQEYITYRKPRQIMEQSEANESIVNLSFQSLPIILENDQELNQLRQENETLRLQLLVANSEIDNLTLENGTIKKALDEHKTRIEILKSVGIGGGDTSPPKFFSPQYRRQRHSMMKMGYPRVSPGQFTNGVIEQMASFSGSNQTASNLRNVINITEGELKGTSRLTETVTVNNDYKETCVKPVIMMGKPGDQLNPRQPGIIGPSHGTLLPKKVSSNGVQTGTGNVKFQPTKQPIHSTLKTATCDKTAEILIIGDEQVKGLAAEMINTRKENILNNTYKVSALIKPKTTGSQILHDLEDRSNQNCEDIYVLAVGKHDQNPHSLLSELSIALYKLRRNRVFVINVQETCHLNEKLLNFKIKSIVRGFQNCNFIQLTLKSNTVNDRFFQEFYLETLCAKLNTEIDYIKYKKQFIDTVMSKSQSNIVATKKHETKQLCTVVAAKKGTIPYYFTKKGTKVNEIETAKDLVPKKGTLPYLFDKIKLGQIGKRPKSVALEFFRAS